MNSLPRHWSPSLLSRHLALSGKPCPGCMLALRRASSSRAGPQRLSKLYAPTSKFDAKQPIDGLRSVQYLLKGGFIRQSSAGIYSLLPLGIRVLEKLERIIEEEMCAIDASKVSLPHLLQPHLWQKSGRWESTGPELWRLHDRRKTEMLLAPTHEEEITALVASDVISEKQLPIRLFQIGRKFRDEARPRAGLLRGKEFLMKDLYTFDATPEGAAASYNEVKQAYNRIFDRIGVEYAVADADTGNIGGTSSHEFHYISTAGEDTLISCPLCSYSANSELAITSLQPSADFLDEEDIRYQTFNIPSSRQLGIVVHRKTDELNMLKVQRLCPDAQQSTVGKPLHEWDGLKVLLDSTCVSLDEGAIQNILENALHGQSPLAVWGTPPAFQVGDFRTAQAGDICSKCQKGKVKADTSIEVGHTFLLGQRYSKALDASFAKANDPKQGRDFFHMGCYGIGVSRLLGSVAEVCADEKGLRWPSAIAPYRVCMIATDAAHLEEAAAAVEGSHWAKEAIVDDRYGLSFGSRMKDAELVGYPCIVILGKRWASSKEVEVQNRWTGEKAFVPLGEAQAHVRLILAEAKYTSC